MADNAPTDQEAPPWDAKRNKPKSGGLRRLLMWALLIAFLVFVFYGLKGKSIEVETGLVSRGPLTVHVVEEGKTRIRNRFVVSAPVAGLMRRVILKPGATVVAGETMLTVIEPSLSPLLDPRTQAQAEARLQATQASVKRAEQTLELARTVAQFAKANWERIQGMQDQRSVSITDRDNAQRDAEMRLREVYAAEFAQKVSFYELDQAKAALLQIQSPDIKGSTVEVKAPVSGRILRVEKESEANVMPGTAILEIGDPANLEIEAEILSRDAVGIKPGADVRIEQWGGDAPLQGRVRLVEPAAFTKISALGVEEQRVIVLTDLVNPPAAVQALGDRYRVEVHVAVWHQDDVLLIPSGALFREGSEWKTFVFDNGKAKKVPLEAGRSDGLMTEVLKGLTEKTEVLLHPPDSVKDGADVVKRVVP
ncbi:HlyD family efflux transporter periplasmic adaptor subunit [soil metagenome]